MTDIVNAVTRVTDIMGEIASASDEQSRGIDQVAIAVAEMDSVTQQNASLVEESASAAAALEEQAERLNQAVAAFRLNVASGNRATTSVPAATLAEPRQAPAANRTSDSNWETF